MDEVLSSQKDARSLFCTSWVLMALALRVLFQTHLVRFVSILVHRVRRCPLESGRLRKLSIRATCADEL